MTGSMGGNNHPLDTWLTPLGLYLENAWGQVAPEQRPGLSPPPRR
jgi:hypothetical protein